MELDTNKIAVFACEESDWSEGMKPDGYASSEADAARIIRRRIAQRDGDGDTGITAGDVVYSQTRNAWFIG